MNSNDYDLELRFSHYSCANWRDPNRWSTYFERVQEILGAEITHLDEDDPVRRKMTDPNSAGEFVTRFGEEEDDRWIFSEIKSLGMGFTIWYFRNRPDQYNSINWHGPPEMFDDPIRLKQICELFDCGNSLLDTFYSYADTREVQVSKKWRKEFGGVNFQDELLGVYWLTYFNERYVEFFGREKFQELKNVAVKLNGGATLRLAETPSAVPEGLREEIEQYLGPKSFVAWQRDITIKRPGQYALTFEQLRA
jgi:hypothetical protein